MNPQYFASLADHTYVNAGYRWAACNLEGAGIVKAGAKVDVDAVLAAEEYWNPPCDPGAQWLHDRVLPRVKRFLLAHRSTDVLYVEPEDLPGDRSDWIEWNEGSD